MSHPSIKQMWWSGSLDCHLTRGKELGKDGLGEFIPNDKLIIEPQGREWSHVYALSFGEKGNSRSHMALDETPLNFKVSHTF